MSLCRSVRQSRQLALGDTLGINHEYMYSQSSFLPLFGSSNLCGVFNYSDLTFPSQLHWGPVQPRRVELPSQDGCHLPSQYVSPLSPT